MNLHTSPAAYFMTPVVLTKLPGIFTAAKASVRCLYVSVTVRASPVAQL